MWLNKMSLATRTTTIKKGKECSEEKKKKKGRKESNVGMVGCFCSILP